MTPTSVRKYKDYPILVNSCIFIHIIFILLLKSCVFILLRKNSVFILLSKKIFVFILLLKVMYLFYC